MPEEAPKNPDKVEAGKARAKALKPSRRSEIARNAARARWAGGGPIPAAVFGSPEHPLRIGDIDIACYVLEDGRRVLAQRGMQTGIGMSTSGGTSGAQRLAQFLETLAEKGIDCSDLAVRIRNPILFTPVGGGPTAYGYEATLLPDVCDAVLEARKNNALLPQQAHFAKQCEVLVRGFARVGIIALVDSATGYEKVRARQSLEKILEQFVAKELQKWLKTFPDEFYQEIFRLNRWPYVVSSVRRPGVVGHWTNDIVYARLAPGVLEELRRLVPRDESGRLKNKLFQRLNPDMGHPRLREHLSAVVALMKASGDWKHFYRLLDRALPRLDETPDLPFDDFEAMEKASQGSKLTD